LRSPSIALALCVFFFLAGFIFTPLAGIQNDEALFAAGIYRPILVTYSANIFNRDIPLMILSYLGTLKSWVYKPIFGAWRPSAYSTRVPVLLFGALGIWMFFLLTRRILGDSAAIAGTALFATDPLYLLTTCYDWGPVALQHFLWIAGVLLLVQYARDGSRARLASAFFVFGLGLWDKALFLWPLCA